MKPLFKYAGIAASLVLIAFGIGAVVMGISGRGEVRDNIARENIVGSPDMTPTAIKAEAAKAGLKASDLDLPTLSVAGKKIDTGEKAKAFAAYMRIHTFEATQGQTYSEMARYLTAAGKPTNDETAAAVDKATGKPVENGARNIWVTETALTTALNTSFFAENVANFAIVMGVAMLLVGAGFLVFLLQVPAMATAAAKAAKGAKVSASPAAQV